MLTSKIYITGAAGFIGSSLVKFLNQKGITDLILIDSKIENWKNLAGLQYQGLLFESRWIPKSIPADSILIHLGANSGTDCPADDWTYENNVEYPIQLFTSQPWKKVIFASSAAVYGNSSDFSESNPGLPENFYAFTKQSVENWLKNLSVPNWYALRLFNVYGDREGSKPENNRSPIYNWMNHDFKTGPINYFDAPRYSRDFVDVEDVCEVIYYFIVNQANSGIYNVGSGQTYEWEQVLKTILEGRGESFDDSHVKKLEYPPVGSGYQKFTKADLTKLKAAGYNKPFKQITVPVDIDNKRCPRYGSDAEPWFSRVEPAGDYCSNVDVSGIFCNFYLK